ncbi:hypothetical protein PsorP6_002875 [Peronosclerospora sorghi]|uniref:Uncharacterized protein n=1 Tax=Peronosclerospora sorghi TaxID=230839 RepID=A0ACC0VM49_9STRA|nr:hypothetical protein PsorP6_002875 [Peronosclerospora sorghi]
MLEELLSILPALLSRVDGSNTSSMPTFNYSAEVPSVVGNQTLIPLKKFSDDEERMNPLYQFQEFLFATKNKALKQSEKIVEDNLR